MARSDELDAAKGKPAARAAAKTNRLDDPATQEAIREPGSFTAMIGGAERKLHALSARKSRELDGLFRSVLADTLGDGVATTLRSMKMVGVLLERYSQRAIPFIAAALEPPGALSEAGIEARAAEIDETITSQELADAFIALCEREKVLDRFSRPREAPDSAPK